MVIEENMVYGNTSEYGLSIIIPTYNVEKYIGECLECILKQIPDESEEIICVDDGSTDETVALINAYVEKSRIVRCICKEHEGAGAARNLGLSEATKKYISFLDADDYYEDGAIEKIRDACLKSDEEIISFAYWNLLDNHDIREDKIVDFPDNLTIPRDGKIMRMSEWQNDYGYTNFIFNREFLIKNNVSFPSYMRYEDPVFLLKALCCAGSFRVMPASIYVCRVGYKDSSELDRAVADVLRGIRDNLISAFEHDYESLRKVLLRRIDVEFYEAIYRGLSDEVMRLLLDISEVNNRFDQKIEISLLRDIYKGLAGQRISERNYEREQAVIRDYGIFNNVTKCMKRCGGFGRYLLENGIKNVCIYGAGLYGRLLVQDFLLHGIETISVIDRNSVGNIEGIKIIHPDSDIPKSDLLIIALRDTVEVEHEYQVRGIQKVIGLSDLADRMVLNQSFQGDLQ